MDLAPRVGSTTADPSEIEHLRNRVRLYLQVLLIIDVVAYISDYVTPLFIDGLTPPTYPLLTAILRWSVTGVVGVGWAIARFTRPGRAPLIAIESGVTMGLTLVYIHISSVHMDGAVAAHAPVFAMYGIILLLSVRAALVPSPVVRTIVIGVLTIGSLFVFGRASIRNLDPRIFDGITFIGGAFVLVTSVTSHVIYGLRREVRHALQLGQYTLREKLGEGGMGAVYRAEHAMLRRQAAIKLIKPELSGEGSLRTRAAERFEREADVTANLKSPHTVELYDFGVSVHGAFYYVMELLDGIDLESAVAKYGPMSPDRVVYILLQVCDSLGEAHAVGLVHRDIKPANIFLCHHGLHYDFVKVLDFGLVALDADRTKHDQKLTADGFAGGTPAYIAPEVVAGTAPVDGRADIYALGCVAYWLLSGHTPFERENSMATILAHLNETPLPPSAMSESEIPTLLDSLVLECLAKRPDDRPDSARELSRRLEGALDSGSWNQGRAERWWKTHHPSRRVRSTEAETLPTMKITKTFG